MESKNQLYLLGLASVALILILSIFSSASSAATAQNAYQYAYVTNQHDRVLETVSFFLFALGVMFLAVPKVQSAVDIEIGYCKETLKYAGNVGLLLIVLGILLLLIYLSKLM